jgi:hypothetical protein
MKRAVWPLAGALLGALGWFSFIYFLMTSMSQYEIAKGWKSVYIILCPAATIPRAGAWSVLIANCLFYAVVFEGLRRITKKLD